MAVEVSTVAFNKSTHELNRIDDGATDLSMSAEATNTQEDNLIIRKKKMLMTNVLLHGVLEDFMHLYSIDQ